MVFRKGRNERNGGIAAAAAGLDAMNPSPFAELLSVLRTESEIRASIDEPADPDGPWWLDVHIDGNRQSVVWDRKQGFGLFVADVVFGEHPDGVFETPALAAARLLQLAKQRTRTDAQSPMSLRDLRHLVGQNQKEVALSLHKAQSAVSKIEKGADPKLSTVRDYIAAMGGHLVVTASFPDFVAPITIGSPEESSNVGEVVRVEKVIKVTRKASRRHAA